MVIPGERNETGAVAITFVRGEKYRITGMVYAWAGFKTLSFPYIALGW